MRIPVCHPAGPARVVVRRRAVVARPRRRRHRGQTMIEFSFVFVLLLFGIFGSVSGALWAVENMAAVSAVENATRLVAAAQGVNGTSADNSVAQNPTAVLTSKVLPQVKQSMFGTPVSVQPWGSCPASPSALSSWSSPRVYICARRVASAAGTFQVQVMVAGCAASMTGRFGFGGCGSGVPIYQFAAVQELVFNK